MDPIYNLLDLQEYDDDEQRERLEYWEGVMTDEKIKREKGE